MIVDGRTLYVLGFNYTHLDIDRSRSFGVVTNNRRLVQEAIKLFEADFNRQPYKPGLKKFLVSPENSRSELAALLKGAKKQLLIYDVRITDNAMIRILKERAKAGVEIRMLGKLEKKDVEASVEKFPGKLHARVIIQDGRKAFVGSQSLRRLELDGRREVGVIFTDPNIVRQLISTFESDWAETDSGKKGAEKKSAKKKKKKKSRAVRQASALPRPALCTVPLPYFSTFATMSVRIGPRTASSSSFSFCGTPAESSAFTRSSTSASKSALDSPMPGCAVFMSFPV